MCSTGLCNSVHSSEAQETARRSHPVSKRSSAFHRRVSSNRCGVDEYLQKTEADLLSRAQAGDHQAFVELCNRHKSVLKGRIFRIVKNQDDTEDILQETLMRAYEHLGGFMGRCAFRTWMVQIATNSALMLLRRRKTGMERWSGFVGKEGEILDFPEVADPAPNPEQIFSRVQTNLIVSNEVSRLPAGSRPLMDLYYGEEISLIDAAHALGLSEGAAKSRLTRARALLRRRLERQPRPLKV